MTVATAEPTAILSQQHLSLLMQYTVEAYKTFQKLAENLPNPMTASMFKQFAADERTNRDLIEMKIAAVEGARVRITLGADLQFQDILEGEQSYRETTEALIVREKVIQKRLRDWSGEVAISDRNLLIYLETVKRAHIVELERELELLKLDRDWWKREDAEWRIVHGSREPVTA